MQDESDVTIVDFHPQIIQNKPKTNKIVTKYISFDVRMYPYFDPSCL
jgi:hypothetical protein